MRLPIPSTSCVTTDDSPAVIHNSFTEHGFCVFRNFLSHREVEEAIREIELFKDGLKDSDISSEHIMYDDPELPSTLKQIQRLHGKTIVTSRTTNLNSNPIILIPEHSPFFGELMTAKMEPISQAALGEGVVQKNMQYFNKPEIKAYKEGRGSLPTPPHQDGFYFMIEPAAAAVTMWLALEPAESENGCLSYIRGSHRRGMRKHGYSGVFGFSQKILDFGTDEVDIPSIWLPFSMGLPP